MFGVPVKLPLVPELEKNSAHAATISILLNKTAVLGWQRETRHWFKVKLQWLWPKNQKNNPMRVIQSIQLHAPSGGFSFLSLPKPRPEASRRHGEACGWGPCRPTLAALHSSASALA